MFLNFGNREEVNSLLVLNYPSTHYMYTSFFGSGSKNFLHKLVDDAITESKALFGNVRNHRLLKMQLYFSKKLKTKWDKLDDIDLFLEAK